MNPSLRRWFPGVKRSRPKARPASVRTRPARTSPAPLRGNLDLWMAAVFLVLMAILGGTSQDIPALFLAIELISVAGIAFGVWRLSAKDAGKVRPFAIAALLLMAVPALQLIPLPPGLWATLPGHDLYLPTLRQVGLDDTWRPLSLSPDRTQDALLSVLPVLAAALLFAPLDTARRTILLDVLLACLAVSALVAVSQIAVRDPYFYDITNRGSGVGLFSNRNHQALFVAIGILLVMARWRLAEMGQRKIEVGAMAAGALFLILPLLLVTGSRSGLLTGVLAFIGGGLVFLRHAIIRQPARRRWTILAIALVLAGAALALALFSSRLTALDRLFASDASDLRVVNLPAMLDATRAFFPFGTGFGTFDPVFRQFEPYESLSPAFFNHAHNDLLEIMLEGGMFAVALLVAGTVLMARRLPVLWRSAAGSASRIMAKAGFLGLLLLGIGSLVDYPLRTPFMAVLAMLLATWCFASPDRSETALGTR